MLAVRVCLFAFRQAAVAFIYKSQRQCPRLRQELIGNVELALQCMYLVNAQILLV
jgi:hypothetical protein